jgi:hypothetical protein
MSAPAKSVMSHHREGRHSPFNSARLLRNVSEFQPWPATNFAAQLKHDVSATRETLLGARFRKTPTNRSQRKHEVSLLRLAGPPSRPTDLDPEAG